MRERIIDQRLRSSLATSGRPPWRVGTWGRGEVRQAAGNTQGTLARAIAAHQAGNIPEAEFLYKLVLQADKKNFDALHMLAVIEGQRGNYSAALDRIRETIRVRPRSVDALINLGRIQAELSDYDNAVAAYKKALELDPRSALAHNNLSIVLRKQGQRDAALRHCDAALRIAPNYADAWSNRGNVFFALKQFVDALADYDKAIALQPNHGVAHFNRGNALSELKQREEALAAFRRAIAIDPSHAEAWNGLGNMLLELGQCEDASAAYDRALALRPDLAAAWLGRGNIFTFLRRSEEAFAAFDRALGLDPELPYAEGHRLHAKLQVCDWTNLDAEVSHLLAGLRDGARRHGSDLPRFTPISDGRAYPHDRIRIAYLSSDLRDHAVGYLTIGLFEHHDRSRFETTAISFGPDVDSDFRRRIKAAFDRFIDAPTQSDQVVADLIRQLEIDIAVDLNGLTRSARPGVLARRPAPVQVNYLGYPGTIGADHVDYIVADHWVIPPEQQQFYREKVIYLPNTFQANDSNKEIGDPPSSRAAASLPDSGFVFCAFNNSYKITPSVFDVWMRLLQRVPGSVLWLLADNPAVERNLRREAESRGVNTTRLIFAPRILYADYLARYRLADLFLDTLPFNAGTTASDALWVELPLVTCSGQAFASRMAASLLRAVRMPELVTDSMADYEALAFRLASDPDLMASTRAKLARNRLTKPLFDTELFTGHLEAAYVAAHQRAKAGLAPDHIYVDG
jgi:protein O-GlcNAc transferase